MRAQVGLVLVAGLLVGVDEPSNGKEKKGAKGLEGTWAVVSFTRDGKKDEGVKDDKVIFKGKSLTVKTKRGEEKAAFQIDPKRKAIDITVKDNGREETMKGIFRLKGDELTVCHSLPGQNRPKDFTAEKGSHRVLTVLKRSKDKGDKNQTKMASVEGKVTLDGQPLPRAQVVFVPPPDGGRKATGTTNEKGEYQLVTAGKRGGVRPGPYKVVITKKVAGKSVVPARYGSPETTPLKLTVKEGQNALNIDLTK
jgi:uncharacterized protein (TIGR03067 family)